MTRLLLCFLFSIIFSSGFSQKVYFIYLQTETEQPFYVRVDKTVYSSSSSGYLILAKLKDSVYSFTLGFPQNKWPEQKFSVAMNRKDHGYLVKNFGDKGWGLFDLQTLAVQMAVAGSARIETKQGEDNNEVSPFTDILARAAGDPSLREKQNSFGDTEKGPARDNEKKEVVVAEKKDPVTEKPVEKIEPVIVKSEKPDVKDKERPEKKSEEKAEPVIAKTEELKVEIKETVTPREEYKPSVIIKTSETATGEGLGIVFIDQDNKGKTDTISLVIPNPKPIVAIKETPVKEEKKFIEILPDSNKVVEEKIVVKAEPQKFYHEMNNCPSLAKDNDFFKLRKLMAAAEGDENMIAEAKEYFKARCFSTQQIRNLSSLFLTDEGRYKFFEAAYHHVSDKNNFHSLQTELKEEQYISFFKTTFRK